MHRRYRRDGCSYSELDMALLWLLLFLSSPSRTAAIFKICKGNTYAANSPFGSNLNLLLASLSLSSTNSTFSNLTKGSPPDQAYGRFLCRGDISQSDCRSCVHTATRDAPQFCPSSKQLTLWYDTCQLRYSDESFFSSVRNDSNFHFATGLNATDPDTFRKNERVLMRNLSYQAVHNSNSLFFATGEMLVYGSSDQQTIYGMVQCTRDLSADQCGQCLHHQLVLFQCCDSEIVGGVIGQSCGFFYAVYKFFQGSPKIFMTPSLSAAPLSQPPSSATTREGKKRSIAVTALVIVIPSAAALVLVLGVCIFSRRRMSRKKFSGVAKLEKISYMASLLLDLSTIKAATADFSPEHKLGEGGFGSVYKGILPDGQEIAVKRLSMSSRQGMEELKNELVLVAKLQHKNLVRLQGVCLEKEEKLLAYEYVPNRSLDTFLFDQIQQKQLNWEMRFKIIGGISQGLHYLHEESHFTVIHRDLKASNILLDADMNPKISDFGLSKLFGCEEKECTTRRVVGTLGYMAPEYITRGQFSLKSDVYSFGVLLLEIVTGRKRSKFNHYGNYSDLLSYIWEHWRNGTALEILDPSVKEKFSENEVLICIQIGLLCTQEVPADRPLMSSVLLMLNSHSVTLPAPSQPTSEISEQKSDLAHIPASRNNASISVLEPR